jgi:hypothetical protein
MPCLMMFKETGHCDEAQLARHATRNSGNSSLSPSMDD